MMREMRKHVHSKKRILALPHETLAPPWLVSCGWYPEHDRIWIWKRQRRR